MRNALRVLCAGTVAALAVGAGTAAANNGKGLGRPPLSDSTMVIAPASVVQGSGVQLGFTFTMGSVTPSSGISNGAVEAEAPAGWTITNATIDVSSTCNVSGATISFTSSGWDVEGLSCTSAQTLIVDVTATTPAVVADTPYSFDSSLKSSAGGRHFFDNVFRVAPATVTVTAT